jgi:hypothetical protein
MGVGVQRHAPAARHAVYPLFRRLGGPQSQSGRVGKISPPPGFDPQTVQPVACRYTDWAIPVPIFGFVFKMTNRCVKELVDFIKVFQILPWRWQPLSETCRGKIWNTLIKSTSSLTHLLVILKTTLKDAQSNNQDIFGLFYWKRLSQLKSAVLLVADKLCFVPSDCAKLKASFMWLSEVIPNYCAFQFIVLDCNMLDWSLGSMRCPSLLLNPHWNRIWRKDWGTPKSSAAFGPILPAYTILTATVIQISTHKYNVYLHRHCD